MFGDDDPEDAWDASDSVAEKVAVLERWIPSIRLERLAAHDHARMLERIREALESDETLALEHSGDLELLEVLGDLRDRLLEAREEEGP